MSSMKNSISAYLSELLDARGWTQKEAAKQFGISAAYLNDLLQDRRSLNPVLASRIAHVISPNKLVRAEILVKLHHMGATHRGWYVSEAAR